MWKNNKKANKEGCEQNECSEGHKFCHASYKLPQIGFERALEFGRATRHEYFTQTAVDPHGCADILSTACINVS